MWHLGELYSILNHVVPRSPNILLEPAYRHRVQPPLPSVAAAPRASLPPTAAKVYFFHFFILAKL
jgi:hypothetical protein